MATKQNIISITAFASQRELPRARVVDHDEATTAAILEFPGAHMTPTQRRLRPGRDATYASVDAPFQLGGARLVVYMAAANVVPRDADDLKLWHSLMLFEHLLSSSRISGADVTAELAQARAHRETLTRRALMNG